MNFKSNTLVQIIFSLTIVLATKRKYNLQKPINESGEHNNIDSTSLSKIYSVTNESKKTNNYASLETKHELDNPLYLSIKRQRSTSDIKSSDKNSEIFQNYLIISTDSEESHQDKITLDQFTQNKCETIENVAIGKVHSKKTDKGKNTNHEEINGRKNMLRNQETIESESLFHNESMLSTFLLEKFENFKASPSFSKKFAIEMFGEDVLQSILNKEYLLKYQTNQTDNYEKSFTYFTQYFDFLIKCFISINNMLEELNPYFCNEFDQKDISDEKLQVLLTKRILEIIKDPKLVYLKIYLPELYGLECMPNLLIFRNLKATVIGYLVLFHLHSVIYTTIEVPTCQKYNSILSIFKGKDFLIDVISNGCWFQVFLLCLNKGDFYFKNYKHVLGELVYLTDIHSNFSKIIRRVEHFNFFFKKNLFFYFEFEITFYHNFSSKRKEYSEINFWIMGFDKTVFLRNSSSILKKIKEALKIIVERYNYIKKFGEKHNLDIDSIDDVYEANRWMFLLFTLKTEHKYKFYMLKKKQPVYIKKARIIKKELP